MFKKVKNLIKIFKFFVIGGKSIVISVIEIIIILVFKINWIIANNMNLNLIFHIIHNF